MSDDGRLARQLSFLLEADRLKQVERQTAIIGGSRRENTAEHSWHLGLFALVLGEHADESIDLARVVAMVLVHDLVEIDAGDTFAYDEAGYETKAAREQAAADRLFGLLPAEQGRQLRELWEEHEAASDGRRPLRQRPRPPPAGPPEPRRWRRRAVGAPRGHLRTDRPAQRPHRRRVRGAVGRGPRADHGRGGPGLGGRHDPARRLELRVGPAEPRPSRRSCPRIVHSAVADADMNDGEEAGGG